MSEREEVQTSEVSQSEQVESLEAKIKELENRKKAKESNPVNLKIKELEERLAKLQKEEEISGVKETFNNAITAEQEWDSLNRKIGTREERISALERDTMEKLNDLRNLLASDNYQQYFFSNMNTSERAEKLRRFCVHAYRMSGEEFISKYKNFIMENKYNLD